MIITLFLGVMAVLFCAIFMSQYTHFNLTPITQLTMQMTFRTLSFVAETCTFAYLGLALFSIKLVFQPVFLVWSIVSRDSKFLKNSTFLDFVVCVESCQHFPIELLGQQMHSQQDFHEESNHYVV